MTRLVLLLTVIGLSFSCSSTPWRPDRPTLPEETGATPCERACQRLDRLCKLDGNHAAECCAAAAGTPEGVSCAAVCEAVEESSVTRFCPRSVSQIELCSDLQAAWESCG
jgi:hypothetical protein